MWRNRLILMLFNTIFAFLRQTYQYRKKILLHNFKRTRKVLFGKLNCLFIQQANNAIVNEIITEVISPQLIEEAICYKRIWMKKRSEDHWKRIILETYGDVQWIEDFRMSKNTFQELCQKLENELKPKTSHLQSREPLSVEKQLAIALYKMAVVPQYRVVGSVFGVHKSTVKKCLCRVVNTINKLIMPIEICMPLELEAQYIAQQFETRAHIPQIIGCIDGTHIPILAPEDGYRDYVNRKGWPSYNVQAIVDHNGRFRNVVAKHPGSVHDARVFKESMIYKNSTSLIPKV